MVTFIRCGTPHLPPHFITCKFRRFSLLLLSNSSAVKLSLYIGTVYNDNNMIHNNNNNNKYNNMYKYI